VQGMLQERIYHKLLLELLALFPCVALIGVRQCGKTTMLEQLDPDWQRFDLEKGADLEVISRDPDLFLRLHPRRVAIDEAQLLPAIFPALRVAIDADRAKVGRFIITGSSSPALVNAIAESLAGRVAIIEMAPFTFGETRPVKTPKLAELIAARAPIDDLLGLRAEPGIIPAIHDYWFRGGYPEPWLKGNPRFSQLWLQNYLQTYLDRDIQRLFPGLNRAKFRLFLQMLSNLSGTVINYAGVARALGVSQPTAREYFQIAHGTFIWRHLPPYDRNVAKRVVKHPKGYLRDPGLLHFLLHLRDRNDLLAHPAMGASWEALVIEEILRGMNSLGAACEYYHYRTGGGAEVDLVLAGDFGVLPIEIKYGQQVTARELRPIQDFIDEHRCPYGIVINNDERVRRYGENLLGIPFACS